MRAYLLSVCLLVVVVGCGRRAFDPLVDGGGSADAAVDGPADSLDAFVPPATVSFVSTASSIANLTTYLFPAQPIGAAAPDRIVVVCAYLGGGSTTPISSITVGGVALDLTAVVTDGTSGSWAIGYKTITVGTMADIAVTSVTAGRAAISVYRVTAASETPIDTGTKIDPNNDAAAVSEDVTMQAGGVVIANAGYGSNTRTWIWGGTWTGYSEALDAVWAGEQGSYTSASAEIATGGILSVTSTPSGGTQKLLSVASWR